MVVLLVLSVVLLFLTIDYFAQRSAARRVVLSLAAGPPVTSLGRGAVAAEQLPAAMYLSPGHVWMRVEPEGSVLVGVDRLLLDLLGGVDHVYTLDAGTEVKQGGPLFMVRRGSRALKVRSPVAGRVTSINSDVHGDPSRMDEDPLGAGWVYRIEPRGLYESLRHALSGSEAADFLQRELSRLRDLVGELAGPRLEGRPVLADGGLPADDLAERIDDREWEELVTRFFAAADRSNGALLAFPQRGIGE